MMLKAQTKLTKLRLKPRKMATALLLLVVVIAAIYLTPTHAFPEHQQSSIIIGLNQVANANDLSTEKACSNTIFTNGTITYVQDCITGAIANSGMDAATQINNAIAALKTGGVILVKEGIYILATPIIGTVDGITFEGAGPSVVFKVKQGFDKNIIDVTGSNWVLRNFKIDATNQVRKHTTSGIYVSGNNETVTGIFISATDHAGIDGIPYGCEGKCGYRIRIINNTITNGYDDGIIVRGSNVTVAGNVVDTTKNHNGISLVSPQNVIVVGNNITNTDCGIALENLGYGFGPAKFITITDNTIRNPRFFGFWIFSGDGDSGDHVTFSGNTILNPSTGGIELDSGYGNVISDNTVAYSSGRGIYVLGLAHDLTITGNTVIAPSANGIWFAQEFSSGLIENNTITNSAGSAIRLDANDNIRVTGNKIYYPTSAGIDVRVGSGIVIASNLVRIVGNYRVGIDLLNASTFEILGNNITGSGISGVSQLTAGIRVTNSSAGIIALNVIVGDAASTIVLINETNTAVEGNRVNIAAICVLEGSSMDDYNMIVNNTLSNCSTPISYQGSHDIVANNSGFKQGTNQSAGMAVQTEIAIVGVVVVAALCILFLTGRKSSKRMTRRKTGQRPAKGKPKGGRR